MPFWREFNTIPQPFTNSSSRESFRLSDFDAAAVINLPRGKLHIDGASELYHVLFPEEVYRTCAIFDSKAVDARRGTVLIF